MLGQPWYNKVIATKDKPMYKPPENNDNTPIGNVILAAGAIFLLLVLLNAF